MTDQSNIEKLTELAAKLSPEERDKLADIGVILPAITQNDLAGNHRWGYRCKYCGGMALVFVGETFNDGSGTSLDKPPTGIPLSQIPFAQPAAHPSRRSRMNPVCQCCGQNLVLARGYIIEKYVVQIDAWQRSRHAGLEALKKHRVARDNHTATHNPDGTPISIANSYDKGEDAQLRETRARQEQETPGITAVVEEVAAKFDLLNAIQSGPSGKRGRR
jgi:hypothetical protein